MKVLLIILIAFRAASILKEGLEEHNLTNEMYRMIPYLVVGGLWIASLVWLIKL